MNAIHFASKLQFSLNFLISKSHAISMNAFLLLMKFQSFCPRYFQGRNWITKLVVFSTSLRPKILVLRAVAKCKTTELNDICLFQTWHAASEEDQANVAPARLPRKLVGTAQTKLKGKATETLGPRTMRSVISLSDDLEQLTDFFSEVIFLI